VVARSKGQDPARRVAFCIALLARVGRSRCAQRHVWPPAHLTTTRQSVVGYLRNTRTHVVLHLTQALTHHQEAVPMWEFLRSVLKLMQDAIQSGDATVRLALLLCLLIVLVWVLTRLIG
jgi:hypothetical protein